MTKFELESPPFAAICLARRSKIFDFYFQPALYVYTYRNDIHERSIQIRCNRQVYLHLAYVERKLLQEMTEQFRITVHFKEVAPVLRGMKIYLLADPDKYS